MISKYLKWATVLVVISSLGVFIYNSDIQGISENLVNVGFKFIYIILVTFLAQIFGTLSWRSTMPLRSKISFGDLFVIRYIGEHIGLVNPANFVGGDAFKAYQLEKRGVPYKESVSSLVVARIIMIYVQVLVFLVVAIIYYFYMESPSSLLLKAIFASVAFIVISILMALASDRLFQINIFKKNKVGERINEVRSTIGYYYKYQGDRLLMSVFWAVINFLVGALEIWLICHFIGIDISHLEALLIDQGALFFKSFAAFIPGQIGVEEYINKMMLMIIGISSASVWVSVSILRRARQLFWILLGVVIYYVMLSDNEKNEIVKLSYKTR